MATYARPAPEPVAQPAQGGAGQAWIQPEPSSVDGRYEADWLDGSNCPLNDWLLRPCDPDPPPPNVFGRPPAPGPMAAQAQRGAVPVWVQPAPVLAKRVGNRPAEPRRAVVQHRGEQADAIQRRNMLRAQDVGILGQGPESLPLDWADPTRGEIDHVAQIEAGVLLRLRTARMQSKDKRTATGLGALEEVRARMPNLVFFKPLECAGDLRTSAYNERSLCLIAEAIRQRRDILADSVAGYVSAVKTLVERDHGQPLLCPGPGASGKQLSELYLSMRREDGPRGHRRLGRAMRSAHIRRVVGQPGYAAHALTRVGCMEHAIRHTSHQCFLRPGEVGTVDNQPFCASTQLVCGPASVQWVTAAQANSDRPKVFILVLSIKDSEARRQRVPITIEPRAPGGGSVDPFCPYLAILAWWSMRTAGIPSERWDDVPLFIMPGTHPASTDTTKVFTGSQMLPLVRRDAVPAGLPPDEVFGNAYRIGGATDLRDAPSSAVSVIAGPIIGMEQATRMIKERGRWHSDIYEIYERVSMQEHALASAAITEAGGIDLEQILVGWIQPGR